MRRVFFLRRRFDDMGFSLPFEGADLGISAYLPLRRDFPSGER
ncbi:hypothetical protein GZL_08400 [Streptomyces sp. 769]|nr:hypothetical protein GZL_08400 [Streptomyces sp. 769]